MDTRRTLMAALAVLATTALTDAHAADAWPTRPIRLVVAGGAGSVADIRARWIAERLSTALGQPFVIENKPAAGGNAAMQEGARSAPDGYTLVVVHQGTMTINPHLYAKPGYDALTDFTPITRMGIGSQMLVVHPDVPARTVAELVALAKARPGTLNVGSPGIGTPPFLAGELFKRVAGIDAQAVPYNGGGALAAALVGGQVTFAVEGITSMGPQVRAGRLRALAVTGPHRAPNWPDVPTMAEAGYPDAEYLGWVGLAGPAGLPPEIVDRLYRELVALYATQEARDWFASLGLEAGAIAPGPFGKAVKAEHSRMGRMIRELGIRIE